MEWYTKIRLWFKPMHCSFDAGASSTYFLFYKVLDNRIYIIGSETNPPLKEAKQ